MWPYRVGSCLRSLNFPGSRAFPPHPNVVAERIGRERTQRGFFPADQAAANRIALAYWHSSQNPFSPPEPVIYVDSVVREDPDEGTCQVGDVTAARFRRVKDRMLRSVHTNPPWHEYHAFERNSIMWAGEVLTR